MKALRRSIPLMSLVLASMAGADSKLEPPDPGRFLRWGPLRVRPGLDLTNLGYDDNILRDPDQRVSDFTATVTPHLDGLVLFGDRAFLTFSERLSYTAYLDNTDQSFFDHRGKTRLTLPFGKIGAFADLGLARNRERPIDLESIRPRRDERLYGGGVVAGFGWRTEIELGYRQTDYEYSELEAGSTVAQRLDRVEEGLALEARYRVKGRTRLTLDVDREDVRFEQSTAKDARRTSTLVGVELGRGGPLTGTARLGWADIEALDPSVPAFSGLVGDASLSWRLGGGLRLQWSLERDQEFSLSEDSRYYRATEVETRALRYLNRIIGIEAGLGVGRLTFHEGRLDDRVDEILRYEVGVRFRLAENSLGRRIEYAILLRHYDRRSSVPGLDNSATALGVNAVVGF